MIVRVLVKSHLFGDRVIVPEHFIQHSEETLAEPQYLILTTISPNEDRISIPCGVLEYSAPDGEIFVSEEVLRNLNIEETDFVKLESVFLPKVTSISLNVQIPVKHSINLEQILMNRIIEKYSCVYNGQTLVFTWENESITCLVSQLQPSHACSFVDANVEVNLNTTTLQETQAQQSYSLSPETPTIEIACCNNAHYLVEINQAGSHQLIARGSSLCCILYLGFTPEEEAYHDRVPVSSICHSRSYFIDCEKTLPIPPCVSICIEVLQGDKLFLSLSSSEKHAVQSSLDGTVCPVCHRTVPRSSYELHLVHCQRFVRPCPICNQPVSKQQEAQHQHCSICSFVTSRDHMDSHMFYEHTPRACICGQDILPVKQGTHYQEDCPKRQVYCRFCHESHSRDASNYEYLNDFQQDPVDRFEGLTKHESVCANKTYTCLLCQEYVMARYLTQHYYLQHQKSLVPDRSVVCVLCGFRQNCIFPSCLKCGSHLNIDTLLESLHCANRACKEHCCAEDTSLCTQCHRAIFTAQKNNPKAIVAFLSQCYLKQWKVGCKENCCNPFCKSFSGEAVEIPHAFRECKIVGKTDSEIITKVIQLANTSYKNKQYFLCPKILNSCHCLKNTYKLCNKEYESK